jgi:hypothetical protein
MLSCSCSPVDTSAQSMAEKLLQFCVVGLFIGTYFELQVAQLLKFARTGRGAQWHVILAFDVAMCSLQTSSSW